MSRVDLPKRIRDKIQFRHAEKQGETAHWIWTGYVHEDERGYRYGQISIDNVLRSVHRYIYELLKGKLSEEERLFKQCDVDLCVNPNHWIKK